MPSSQQYHTTHKPTCSAAVSWKVSVVPWEMEAMGPRTTRAFLLAMKLPAGSSPLVSLQVYCTTAPAESKHTSAISQQQFERQGWQACSDGTAGRQGQRHAVWLLLQ